MRLLALLIFTLVSAIPAGAEQDWVKVSEDKKGFVLSKSGHPFIPWGLNYDHDADGKLIEDYWDANWSEVESSFKEMKQLGANIVRVHLQFAKFMESATLPRQSSLDQLARLVSLAEQQGLYLDVTGLGCYHKQDVPAWYDALDEEGRWQSQSLFWEAIAKTCAESPAIFCYDLMNEPVVAAGEKRRDDWLGPAFGDKHFVQFITLDRHDRDRPDIARKWIQTLVTAIRKHDQRHLVTVGLVPWSLDRPGLSSGFVPGKVAPDLDFISVHIYPEAGKLEESLETLKGFAAAGKPVVIEEIFPLKCGAEELEQFIDQSRPIAAGWIGFFWGRTPEEIRPAQSVADSLTLSWLELFQKGSPKTVRSAAKPDPFLNNGVTAHRGNSEEFPENTLPAFESGIQVGADWIELDIFKTRDGKLVVIHDKTTDRVGDKKLSVPDSTYEELLTVDVATDFRRRTGKSIEESPPQRIPLLEDVLKLAMKQDSTRVSIQPKMDCVPEAIELVKKLHAEKWVGFNDGNLKFMSDVKRLAPEIPVFWDRGANTNIDDDIEVAKKHGFEALVLHESGVTPEKIQKVQSAGLEFGAWTVNDRSKMEQLLEMGVQRIYTDQPRLLLTLKKERRLTDVTCEGMYSSHLQGVCIDDDSIYWSFTTTLVKTDLDGKVVKKVPVANHHGDLCHEDGKIYVAVNLGKFNNPNGNAKSWVYVYDADTLQELARHDVHEVFHGAGGIDYRNGHFYVVGGLPAGVEENYVYEYDGDFKFLKKHIIKSGHTDRGIQTATFAHDQWWFGCYGSPQVLLVTDSEFQMLGRYQFSCSLGIEGLSNGRMLAATGKTDKEKGCSGRVRVAIPDEVKGLKYQPAK